MTVDFCINFNGFFIMKISLNWLKTYIDFPVGPEDIAHRLTMVGLEVEEIHHIEPLFDKVVIGRIKTVKNHPNANKLKICQVQTGKKLLSVVCGAPNVREGICVPVAKIGGRIGGAEIREVQIRGELSQDHTGILVMKDCDHTGDPFLPELQVGDTIFEINVTPNRPDCLSYLGIAREVSVIFKKWLEQPRIQITEDSQSTSDLIQIELHDPSCPRYSARIIQDVHIAPSPAWLKARLQSVGIRSINNVVDITNFILMETGHPLHAFDYDRIASRKIRVRKAHENEIFVTLDGLQRNLDGNDLLICDGDDPVALAGIMGGQNSEVSDSTRHILLESAYFDPMTIRKTSKRLGMSTEASQRFERGADPNGTLYALNKASGMISEIASGRICRGIVDIYPEPVDPKRIIVRSARVKQILGSEIPEPEILTILKYLNCSVENENPLTFSVPTARPDLNNEIDLIEEIIRHYGYETIEPKTSGLVSFNGARNTDDEQVENIRNILCGLGFLEVWNSSLVSERHIKTLTPGTKPVKISNPLSPETQYLRTCGLAGILDALQWNINRNERHLRLFESAHVFAYQDTPFPVEKIEIAAAVTGDQSPRLYWQKKAETVDFYHLKGLLSALLESAHIPDCSFQPGEDHRFGENMTMIFSRDQQIGMAGEIKSSILKSWEIEQPVFAFLLQWEKLQPFLQTTVAYTEIPKFPAIKRDLAFIVDRSVPVKDLIHTIYQSGGDFIRHAEVFDVYYGDPLTINQKSIAFALTFMSMNRTLKEEDINPAIGNIIESLEKLFQAALRS
jgi:phenylalanyl-tRNA synthetase beta chain